MIALPDGMHGPEVSEAIKARGFTVGGGYGELKETTIRIGHMGDHTRRRREALPARVRDGDRRAGRAASSRSRLGPRTQRPRLGAVLEGPVRHGLMHPTEKQTLRQHRLLVAFTALAASIAGIRNDFAYDDILVILHDDRILDVGRWIEFLTTPYWAAPHLPDLYRPVASLSSRSNT